MVMLRRLNAWELGYMNMHEIIGYGCAWVQTKSITSDCCEEDYALSEGDSDYGGCKRDFKLTSAGCQFFGTRLVTWQCKKQTSVSTSTCEAEYIAAASCCSQIIWIQQQLRDYGLYFSNTPIYVDNTAAIAVTKNPVQHSKTKHIDMKYHFIRD
ncbi:hypothetical protein E3N88_23318 [Mikania micrantha]|uniref:Reverse transcriptase Ty1/copia-type domain-containing protein n=1 Tax=Mikania micrantha TaxID=192012 RepID=A0A5N6NES5_9ASTR|nr:hypothetical protein E3N88_23318 [Mikania micrantha]